MRGQVSTQAGGLKKNDCDSRKNGGAALRDEPRQYSYGKILNNSFQWKLK
jgi:hypothetical protein